MPTADDENNSNGIVKNDNKRIITTVITMVVTMITIKQ